MLFLLFFIGFVYANSSCEPGWTPFNGNCYKHIVNFENRVTWDVAVAECALRNSYVTTVESPEEFAFLTGRTHSFFFVIDKLLSRIRNTARQLGPQSRFRRGKLPRLASLTGGGTYFLDYLLVGAQRYPGTRTWYWPPIQFHLVSQMV